MREIGIISVVVIANDSSVLILGAADDYALLWAWSGHGKAFSLRKSTFIPYHCFGVSCMTGSSPALFWVKVCNYFLRPEHLCASAQLSATRTRST